MTTFSMSLWMTQSGSSCRATVYSRHTHNRHIEHQVYCERIRCGLTWSVEKCINKGWDSGSG